MRIFIFFLLLSISSVAQKTNPVDNKVQEFEAYIKKAQQEWQVPGLAVAVVKDGRVLMAKGFGVRQLGTSNAVDGKTLFSIGSTTKAITATCLGMLVDEGKLSWDDAVVTYLPDFQLYDPFVTREIKIRDLLVHDTGLGNADFLWGIMDISSDEILHKMRYVEPTYSLRSSFIYQNIFYLAAGKVIEKVSGRPWSQFIRERIFQKLKMTRTFPYLADVHDANQTRPHYKVEGTITVIEDTSADQVGPAGSVWASIEDMSLWVKCMLDSSKYEGGRLLTPRTWTEMFKPQVIVPANQFYPTQVLTKPNWTTYGLGWFQHDYKGHKVNFHTGSLAGAIAINAQLPDEKLGVYVFGNYDHAEVRHALMYKAFDLFALGGNRDWSAEFLKLYGNIQAGADAEEKKSEASRVMETKPSLDLSAYAGTYTDPLYGEVVITVSGNELKAEANKAVRATFAHWHFDQFRGWYEKRWYGKGNLSFTLGTDGKVATANFDGIEFSRKR